MAWCCAIEFLNGRPHSQMNNKSVQGAVFHRAQGRKYVAKTRNGVNVSPGECIDTPTVAAEMHSYRLSVLLRSNKIIYFPQEGSAKC